MAVVRTDTPLTDEEALAEGLDPAFTWTRELFVDSVTGAAVASGMRPAARAGTRPANAASMRATLEQGKADARDRITRALAAKAAFLAARTAETTARDAVFAQRTPIANAKAAWPSGANVATARTAFLALADALDAIVVGTRDIANAGRDADQQANDLAQIAVEANRAHLNLLRDALGDYGTPPDAE